MSDQAVMVYISVAGGEVEDLQDLVDGKEVELNWVGSLNGQDVPIKVRISDDPDDDIDDRPPGYEDCGCDPAVGHTLPCLLTPVPSLTKVRFEPQAWVNDYAIEVDAQGETDWFVSVDTAADIVAVLERGRDLDFVKSDPYTPAWIREFQGPFEISVVDADDIAPAKEN